MLSFLKKKKASSDSGEHPAVVDYKKTIEQIKTDQCASLDTLNQDLKQYLHEVRTPVPPARTSDPVYDKEATTLPGV